MGLGQGGTRWSLPCLPSVVAGACVHFTRLAPLKDRDGKRGSTGEVMGNVNRQRAI